VCKELTSVCKDLRILPQARCADFGMARAILNEAVEIRRFEMDFAFVIVVPIVQRKSARRSGAREMYAD
jgi:hypothetical protein